MTPSHGAETRTAPERLSDGTEDLSSAAMLVATRAHLVYATTDNEMQAAAIARRLIEDEGRDATTRDVADLIAEGFSVRSSYQYAVLAVPEEKAR